MGGVRRARREQESESNLRSLVSPIQLGRIVSPCTQHVKKFRSIERNLGDDLLDVAISLIPVFPESNSGFVSSRLLFLSHYTPLGSPLWGSLPCYWVREDIKVGARKQD